METVGTNQAITEIGVPTTVVPLTTACPTAVAQALTSPTPLEITLGYQHWPFHNNCVLFKQPVLSHTSRSRDIYIQGC